MKESIEKTHCCGHGGARPGCGRKPGVKTRPVRLPEWLLEELGALGQPKRRIIEACIAHYGIEPPEADTGEDS